MPRPTAKPVARQRFKLSLSGRRALWGFILLTPWFAGMAIFALGPFVQSFVISLSEVDLIRGFNLRFVGLANYREAFVVDQRFVPLLLRTIADSVINVPIILVFSLVAAFLINQRIRGLGFYRAVFFLPVVVVSGIVVEQLFNQDIANTMYSGIIPIVLMVFRYFGNQVATMVANFLSTILMVLWRSGVQILLFLAGLQGISCTYYEAARVDGATDWEVFWLVTLPMLTPIILVNIIYTIVDSFTDVFNEMLFFIKDVGFSGSFRLGYAAALGWIYFLMIFIIIAIVTLSSRRWVFYGGER
ncbi:MAG: sugar ABC transporter permease [Firmicutes bacterium]|nr:sugar ABC transporter permease [Bacillota bacterium]